MGWLPDFLKNLGTANYGMWNSPTPGLHSNGSVSAGEGGVDVSTPIGTPVYAIADGTVVGAGYWKDNAHGVVTTRINVPGAGTQDLYYQHIQIAPGIKEGQQVKRGQQIGTIGPFNEIEMGFNAQWGQPWGVNHPGPWVKDPRPWIKAILSGNGAAPDTTSSSVGSSGASNAGVSCGADPVCYLTRWWTSTVAPTLIQWGEYVAIFLIAAVLVIVGFFLLNERAAMQIAKKVV